MSGTKLVVDFPTGSKPCHLRLPSPVSCPNRERPIQALSAADCGTISLPILGFHWAQMNGGHFFFPRPRPHRVILSGPVETQYIGFEAGVKGIRDPPPGMDLKQNVLQNLKRCVFIIA
jgi:hypothetical protein